MPASLQDRLKLDKAPVFLVDGSAYVYRAFYAYPDLKRGDGFPTNALFIVFRLLLRILREENPAYLGFYLDGKGPTFRHELYEPYKAQRSATPEALLQQLDPIKEAVRLLGFAVEVSRGCEADDLIASAAAKFKKERPVVIVGADKDLKQCLDERVFLWDPVAKNEKLTTVAAFFEETGLKPSQWPDAQALIGDSSDNIPGAPGVGPKTVTKIFQQIGSLEELRDNLDKLSPGERKKIEPNLDAIFLYRQLTQLRTDLAEELTLEDLACKPLDFETVAAFLREYEFRTLVAEIPRARHAEQTPQDKPLLSPQVQGKKAKAPKKDKGESETQFSLFSLSSEPAARVEQAPAIPVTSLSRIDELPDVQGLELGLALVDQGARIGLDGREWLAPASLDVAGLAARLGQAARVYCPSLKELFTRDPAWESLPLERCFDLGLAAYLLDPEERDYSFGRIWRRFGAETPSASFSATFSMDNPGLAALELGRELVDKTRNAGLEPLLRELEIPLAPVLVRMERRGVDIDRQAFASFLSEVQEEIERVTQRIYFAAGQTFNIRSSQQLGQLLFQTLKLKPGGKTPGGAISTSQDTLEKLVGQHPVIEEIMEFRKLEKLRSTYLEPFPKMVDENGRLHTTFNQTATATGRLSSSNPNLQNIPIRGELGKRMRRCFRAPEGFALVAADYSQIELRVLAHLSRDATLVKAFQENKDIHAATACLLFDKPVELILPDERRNAKTINFGLIYGMGPQKLARELKISMQQAKQFIERYFSRLTGLREFYERVEAKARELGSVTTLAGRRRLLPDIHSRNAQLQSTARRQAINTLIQGSAADIIKLAMLAAEKDPVLQSLSARSILQVHDELILEAPETSAQAVGKRLAELMTAVKPGGELLSVPLLVDWGAGPTWADAH
jgi:DNA polymerase-1